MLLSNQVWAKNPKLKRISEIGALGVTIQLMNVSMHAIDAQCGVPMRTNTNQLGNGYSCAQ